MNQSVVLYAVVRFTVPGFHRWPGAPASRSYLRERHRHLFYMEVKLETFHEEREVEFHDLLAESKDLFPGGELDDRSCETMARTMVNQISGLYPGRRLEVSVFEDNEVGAVVTVEPQRNQGG